MDIDVGNPNYLRICRGCKTRSMLSMYLFYLHAHGSKTLHCLYCNFVEIRYWTKWNLMEMQLKNTWLQYLSVYSKPGYNRIVNGWWWNRCDILNCTLLLIEVIDKRWDKTKSLPTLAKIATQTISSSMQHDI